MPEIGTPPECDRGVAVIVASDDAVTRERAVAALQAAGYLFIDSGSVAAAIGSVRLRRPDLVILEVNSSAAMVALWALRADLDAGRMPIITIARNPTPGWAAECLRLGAADHLSSEFEAVELVARVEAAMRGSAQLERLERRAGILEYLATFDELTWLANRRHLEDELVRATSGADRHHHTVCLVLAAPDDWGIDKLSGDAQPAILREIAVLIGSVRRSEDLAARWDESSFAVLLPIVGYEGAMAFAERLRAVVAAAPIPVGTGSVPVTMSVGCVAYPEHEADRHKLASRAEMALAEAQLLGGNRVVSA